ncbi:hypothetical protein ACIQNG_20670 [Streptomyces sp. NPDC091377]|uniref:hypothetical protein n=1 Tax=Streptomyces sp. NPDC091377 TaxID=3365995 RepID=UPI00382CD15F
MEPATGIIAEAVDALGAGPALVVGHSLGGYAFHTRPAACRQDWSSWRNRQRNHGGKGDS